MHKNSFNGHYLRHSADRNKWSNIGFAEEIGILEIKICTLSGALFRTSDLGLSLVNALPHTSALKRKTLHNFRSFSQEKWLLFQQSIYGKTQLIYTPSNSTAHYYLLAHRIICHWLNFLSASIFKEILCRSKLVKMLYECKQLGSG